jgi:hypothetical protein
MNPNTTNNETLTLYYYDELDPSDRREVEAALNSDLALARQYRELSQELDGLKDLESHSAPSHVVARWHNVIDRAAEREAVATQKQRGSFHFGSFFWGSAVAASLAVGIAIGVYLTGETIEPVNPGLVANQQPDIGAPGDAFSRGLLVHFQESRDQLGGLAPGANGERSELILSIIQQNRLFARMAKQNDSQDLARVLRALEPVLVRLAAEDVTAEDAARLQAQLAFELNIVLTKMSRQVSNNTDALDI